MPTYTVSSLTGLYDALANAQGGDTILLESGTYDKLSLSSKSGFDVTFPGNVTIASADPDNPATFSAMSLNGVSNLTIEDVVFDYEFAEGDPSFIRPFEVRNSENIAIRNSTFDGDVATGVSEAADGFGYGMGLFVSGTTGITVENNEFYDFLRGALFTKSADIVVAGNDVHSIRSDGLNFSQVDGVKIENNYIHDFKTSQTSADHSDMIQFWTNGTTQPSKDILITGNHLDIGAEGYTQSIFMRNDMVDRDLAGEEMFYQNVTITDNVIVNGHLHGITVGETDGVLIRNNTVLHSDGGNPDGEDGGVEIPQIRVASDSVNVEVTHNITSNIEGWNNQSSWNVSANVYVQDQDQNAPGYYGDMFISSSLQMIDGIHSFVALPGGVIQNSLAGAPQTRQPVQTNEFSSSFHMDNETDSPATRSFDATTSFSDISAIPEGTTFSWDFGDGTTAEGALISHTFAQGGTYDVTLTVKLPDGQVDVMSKSIGIEGAELMGMAADGTFFVYDAGVAKAVDTGPADGHDGLDLGATGVQAKIDRGFVERLMGADEFNISLTLTADQIGSAGEVFRLHGSIIVSVDDTGALKISYLEADGGRTNLTSQGVNISDGTTHDIDVSLSEGALKILVDGTVVASAVDVDALASIGSQPLSFGNPWGKANFDGTLSAFAITTHESEYSLPTKPLPTSPTPIIVPDPTIEVVDVVPVTAEDSIDLGGKGVISHVDREEVAFLPGSDEFQIDFALVADEIGTKGEVFRLHSSILVRVDKDGDIHVHAFSNDTATTHLSSTGVNISNGEKHEISISLHDGVMSLSVNGIVKDSAEKSSPLGDSGNHDLVFGNPWGKANFDGQLSAFSVASGVQSEAPDAMALDTYLIPGVDASQPAEEVQLTETRAVSQELYPDTENVSSADLDDAYTQDMSSYYYG